MGGNEGERLRVAEDEATRNSAFKEVELEAFGYGIVSEEFFDTVGLGLVGSGKGNLQALFGPVGKLGFKLKAGALLGLEMIVADPRLTGVEAVVVDWFGFYFDAFGIAKERGICIEFADARERIGVVAELDGLMEGASGGLLGGFAAVDATLAWRRYEDD